MCNSLSTVDFSTDYIIKIIRNLNRKQNSWPRYDKYSNVENLWMNLFANR